MIGALLAVIPLALVDCINPATLTIAACLTIVERPVRALRAYITAVYLTYFSIGAVATLGLGAAIRETLANHASLATRTTSLVPGLLLLASAVYLWRSRRRKMGTPQPNVRIGPRGAALLGVLATFADSPTAVPYVATIAILAHLHLASADKLVVLAIYCVIYTLPLQAVLAIHVRMGRAGHHLIVGLHVNAERWAPLVLSAFCLLMGAALMLDSAVPFLGDKT